MTWTFYDAQGREKRAAALPSLSVEDWHFVGAVGEPAFGTAGVAAYGGGYAAPAFRKLPDGTVELSGLFNISVTTPRPLLLFTLPAGYWPVITGVTNHLLYVVVYGGAAAEVRISPTGQVYLWNAPTANYLSLEDIYFSTGQKVWSGGKGDRGSKWWVSGQPYGDPDNIPFAALVTGDLFLYPDSGDTFYWDGGDWNYTGALPVAGRPALVTSLPAGPSDGTEIYYQADATNGVVWHLRYRAASGSAYRWEYVGGGSLAVRVPTDETFALGAAFVDTATVGPQITLPLAGDYTYNFTAQLYNATQTGGAALNAGLSLGGAAVTTPDFAGAYSISGQAVTVDRAGSLLSQPASRVVKLQYNSPTAAGGTPHARYRELQITPSRVG